MPSCSRPPHAPLLSAQQLAALHIFQGHLGVVEDVAWHPRHADLFGSVGDDKKLVRGPAGGGLVCGLMVVSSRYALALQEGGCLVVCARATPHLQPLHGVDAVPAVPPPPHHCVQILWDLRKPAGSAQDKEVEAHTGAG